MTGDYVYSVTGTPVQPSQVYYRAITMAANTTLTWPFANNDTSDVAAQFMQVTASAGSLVLTLPPADQAPNGYATIIFNQGSNSFQVNDSDGGVLSTMLSGQARYFALTDNTTTAGVWRVIGFGAGSTTANATDLAGLGLKVIASTLNTQSPVTSLNDDYTVNVGDRATMFNWMSGAGTISFDASATLGNGFFVLVRNSGTGTISLDPNGSEFINGQSAWAVYPDESAFVISDGSALYTVGYAVNPNFIISFLALDVSGNSDITITNNQALNNIMNFYGTLTGNITIFFPQIANIYFLNNTTAGSFSITVQTTIGTGVVLAQGESRTVICNGTDMYFSDGGGGGGGGGVSQVSTGTGLTGGPITSSGTIAIATTGVGAGTYTLAAIAINAQGQATSASNGIVTLSGSPSQVSGVLAVSTGGTSVTTFSSSGIVVGNGTGPLQTTSASIGASGNIYGYIATQNFQTGTTYTVSSVDAGKIISQSNASAIVTTLPNSYVSGFACSWVQMGAGQITFSPAAGATLVNRSSQTKAAGQYAMGTLYVNGNATGTAAIWVLAGDTGS